MLKTLALIAADGLVPDADPDVLAKLWIRKLIRLPRITKRDNIKHYELTKKGKDLVSDLKSVIASY